MADTTAPVILASFTLTDDEFNDLTAVRDQLGFANVLLCSAKEGENLGLTTEQLFSYLDRLERCVEQIVSRIASRSDAASAEQPLSWIHITLMLQHLSGQRPGSADQLSDITRRLARSAEIEPSLNSVNQAWIDAITLGGTIPLADLMGTRRQAAKPSAPAKPRASRRREGLVNAT